MLQGSDYVLLYRNYVIKLGLVMSSDCVPLVIKIIIII